MSAQAQERPFHLTREVDQRMKQDTLQRFANNRIRTVAKRADQAGIVPEGFYDNCAELGPALLPIHEAPGGAGMARPPV
ncbi:MAG: acyl-CoA dehydrogenase family protein [Gammaproteobacteria bacterium]|nr:acyl-CoA dehydrogenase family protein [Gammaproteobacteria bacterium]